LKDNFDTLDSLWLTFTDDAELLGLLVDTTGLTADEIMAAKDANVRRATSDATLIDVTELPFVDLSFIESHSITGNYLMNRESIEINIYSANYYGASQVFKCVHRLLKTLPDAQIVHSGQRSTALQGVYCYSLRIKQFVES